MEDASSDIGYNRIYLFIWLISNKVIKFKRQLEDAFTNEMRQRQIIE